MTKLDDMKADLDVLHKIASTVQATVDVFIDKYDIPSVVVEGDAFTPDIDGAIMFLTEQIAVGEDFSG